MGLFTGLLTLPLAPVRGVVWLAEQIEEQARQQWSDPQAVQDELRAVQEAYDAGELSAAERDERADALVARLLDVQEGAAPHG